MNTEHPVTDTHSCDDHSHESSYIVDEIFHHLPYAIFSLALGMVILSFIDIFTIGAEAAVAKKCAKRLFHSFHFLHIVFAVTGCLITFSRFSKRIAEGIAMAIVTALIFCTLSDAVLPYLAGKALGVDMRFHLCIFHEWHNVVPFLMIGLLNGLILSRHKSKFMRMYSLGSHFTHILISSLASLMYLVSEGLGNWYPKMGIIFLLQLVAVVVPCTLADVVVPLWFATLRKKHEKYQAGKYQEIV